MKFSLPASRIVKQIYLSPRSKFIRFKEHIDEDIRHYMFSKQVQAERKISRRKILAARGHGEKKHDGLDFYLSRRGIPRRSHRCSRGTRGPHLSVKLRGLQKNKKKISAC